jgi:hypothetical protein
MEPWRLLLWRSHLVALALKAVVGRWWPLVRNRVLQAIMTTKHLAKLDQCDSQLEQRMAELRDELAAVQRESVSAAEISTPSRSSIRSGNCSASPGEALIGCTHAWNLLPRVRLVGR